MDIRVHGVTLSKGYTPDQIGRVQIVTNAEDLEIGQSILPIPDEAGTDAFETGHGVRIRESTTVLTDGFLAEWDRVRGRAKAAPNRELIINVEDANAITQNRRRRVRRPAETDYERVMFFVNDGIAGLPGVDTTWVLNSSVANLPEKSYWSQDVWGELATDLISYTGKTIFVHDKASGGRCLHYHLITTGHTSGLTISDNPALFDGVNVFAPINPQFHRDPSELINDLIARGPTGRTVHHTDATSIAAHDADGRYHQGLIEVQSTSLANLNGQAVRYLNTHKADRDTYTVTIGPLDWVALTKIRAGDLIPITSAVLGLSSVNKRIASMTLRPAPSIGANGAFLGLWMADLQLDFARRTGTKGLGAGGANPQGQPPVGPTPFEPPGDGTWDPETGGTWTAVVPHEGVADQAMSAWDGTSAISGPVTVRGTPDPAQLHLVPGNSYQVTFAITAYAPNSGDPAERLSQLQLLYRAYPGNADDTLPGTSWQDFATGMGAEHNWGVSDTHVGSSITRTYSYGSGGSEVDQYVQFMIEPAWQCCAGGTATVSVNVVVNGGINDAGPLHGQPVCPEVIGYADGAQTVFTTRYPYAPCSLRVFVGGTNQTSEVEETDPAAGTFTFSYVPEGDGETYQLIEAWYQGGL